MANSPSTANYYIGKGTVAFKKTGQADYRDVGNVPEFEFTPEIEKLDHFSSRQGVRNKDRSVVLEKAATVRMVLEEWTAANLALALLGEPEENTAGEIVISIFSENSVSGSLKFTGTNEVGPRWEFIYPNVEFIPSAALNPISDEWGQIEITGDVLADDNGSFGTARKLSNEDDDNESETDDVSEPLSDAADSESDSALGSESDSDNP